MVSGEGSPDGRRQLAIHDYPMWLAAAVAVAVLVLPWAITLALAHHHHLDASAVSILAAVSIPLSGLWIAWVTLAKGGGSATSVNGLKIVEVADRLAVAVGKQWTAEAAVRRLNEPWPLPVSWEAADAALTDAWGSLEQLATTGAGWPSLPPAGTWAAGPDGLAGEGRELAEVLTRVPTGRLVVLGEPGAGKTMLMVRLVLDLLARRTDGGPVPFLASMASWNPVGQDLWDWLAAQLLIDHPVLAGAPPDGVVESTWAAALFDSGLILPVLDGLDEIPKGFRGPAINRINDVLRPGQRVIVTCRTQEYGAAIRPDGGVEVTLWGAAAIQLRPLADDVVRDYLCDDAGGRGTKARWEPVFEVLGTQTPAGQALETPLMVGLARAIYDPRPGELPEALRGPAELCNPDLADRTAVESLLFDAFIPASYRHDPAGRRKALNAEKWLVFLARHLECTIARPDLDWWQLPAAIRGFELLMGVLVGVGTGVLAGVVTGVVAGVLAGAAVGVVVGAVAGGSAWLEGLFLGPSKEGDDFRSRLLDFDPEFASTAYAALSGSPVSVGIGVGVVSGVLVSATAGAGAGAAVGAMAGASAWAAVSLLSMTSRFRLTRHRGSASPPAVLAQDRRAAIGAGIATGIATGVGIGAVAGIAARVGIGVVAGITAGLMVGVGASFTRLWPSYGIARIWLAMRHQLPWSLMSFLADAHKRGLLRQSGAAYQFRHIELQHRLANRDVNERQKSSSAATCK
jgi:hypothetical protein